MLKCLFFQNQTEFKVSHPHEFIVSICSHYQKVKQQLNSNIRCTLNNMVTDIYDDLDGINDVQIDVCIFHTEDQAPSVFCCKLKSSESVMVINITNDGKKTCRFAKMPRRLVFYQSIKSKSRLAFSFLESKAKFVITATIGGAIGYIAKGPMGLIAGAGIGYAAGDIDKVLGSFDKPVLR